MSQTERIKELVDQKSAAAIQLASDIWSYAELPYREYQSSAALISALQKEGFSIETNVAGIPTCFTATFKNGTGKPVVGLLAEYDALDGLSQKAACPVKEAVKDGAPGHGCGHNLLGAGCYSAAVALKDYMQETNMNGTVIFFGCPAEEGAGSKQFMARAGCFDNVDFAYTWHPATINEISSKGNVAIMGANFIFDGISSHAGGSPHLGRSALDAAELMNIGVNYLREHMIDTARIHYAYSDAGGTAPNVVQDHVVIKYEVRAPKVRNMQELFTRVVNIAKGAALMTETKMQYEVTMAFSDYVPSKTLAPVMEECFREIGTPDWTAEDYALAEEFLRSYSKSTLKNIRESLLEYFDDEDALDEAMRQPLDRDIRTFNPKDMRYNSGSTDVGDVGYATPTVMLNVATSCLGNVGHTWQETALAGSSIGMKGMLTAAKVMTLSCIRTMEQPELIEAAKKELLRKNGGSYLCPLPDYVTPPIGKY